MRKPLVLVLVFLALSAVAAEAVPPTGLISLYSDMCVYPKSGDRHGLRVGILRIMTDTYISYEGTGDWPTKAQVIPLPGGQPKDGQPLRFPIAVEGGRKVMFDGVISARAIDGGLAGQSANDHGRTNKPAHLPKVDPKAPLPDCK